MNPFAHNPFELADRGGLWLSSRIMAYAYRGFRLNPIAVQQSPRWLFVLFGAIIFLHEPAESGPMLPGLAMFALVSYLRLRENLPAIRSEWDASLYRTHGAKALKAREVIWPRSLVLAFILTMLVLTASGPSDVPYQWPFVLHLGMLMSFQFLYWMEAAEPPEPDDGDAFVRPHLA